ncbi:hypothetical protein Z517_09379 [Fonsecaea pedrosoi CBS 271.37]|uniref:Uncharacterized protein n=1 Tax=Fonsecaea pedrosoi CBS 271.37 TaxID=1442368 RepID=A0A0D2GE70_9EURO|nr:uncharacterized protein Z517_09379 [Fonsecaea pedrosoi CBS 271.37]KIW76935.1 hypothetical protein Z517_09379 [Fonsecaea pedrosoi CBS 271.37]
MKRLTKGPLSRVFSRDRVEPVFIYAAGRSLKSTGRSIRVGASHTTAQSQSSSAQLDKPPTQLAEVQEQLREVEKKHREAMLLATYIPRESRPLGLLAGQAQKSRESVGLNLVMVHACFIRGTPRRLQRPVYHRAVVPAERSISANKSHSRSWLFFWR